MAMVSLSATTHSQDLPTTPGVPAREGEWHRDQPFFLKLGCEQLNAPPERPSTRLVEPRLHRWSGAAVHHQCRGHVLAMDLFQAVSRPRPPTRTPGRCSTPWAVSTPSRSSSVTPSVATPCSRPSAGPGAATSDLGPDTTLCAGSVAAGSRAVVRFHRLDPERHHCPGVRTSSW